MSDNKLFAFVIGCGALVAVVAAIMDGVGSDKVVEAKKIHLRQHQESFDVNCEFCDAIQRYIGRNVGKK